MATEDNIYTRTQKIIGARGLEILNNSRIAVFGLGGVGGYAVEALCRSGIGVLDIVDNDIINSTNLNRQIIATTENIGMYKTDEFEKRIHLISPKTIVNKYKLFYLPNSSEQFDFSSYDYVIDAIDTVSAKIDIIKQCKRNDVPIISCMGCGNRLNPSLLEITDIYKTKNDPLSRIIRKKLRKENISNLKVVYSSEDPIKKEYLSKDNNKFNERVPASMIFVPASAGIMLASEVVKDLIQNIM